MTTLKRLSVLLMVFITAVGMVMGQANNGANREMSVEESYLQESVEMMIIREQSRTDNRDQKLVALEYIGDAINRGNTGEEIRTTLEYLALEGTVNRAQENGRLINNYPDVRTKATTYLGDLGTPEAKNTLIRIILADPEPMVLTEAVKSLGRIGINDNDETVSAIAKIVNHFDSLKPDNLLALSAVEAFEKFAATGTIKDPNIIQVLNKISYGSYITPVKERAKQVVANIRKSAIQSAQNSGNK
ncbi:hypothetical protein AGMMS49546_37480 [Spirochaetia bacterium]|nr:hypothetical protein AGMMS49546_37480 [Spirochaetia bacterium]